MLDRIVTLALRFGLLVAAGSVIVAFLGVRAWQRIPLDAFPDVTPVQVNVYTEAQGLAPEDVEKLITFPVESAVAGLPGVEGVRSLSLFGLSYVSITFRDRTDIYFARRLVAERLVEAKEQLPEGTGVPLLGPNTSGLGQVFWYTLGADKGVPLSELRTLQDWVVRPILRTAPGVDDVLSLGGFERQFQVLADPRRLAQMGMTFGELAGRLTANNRQVGGQFIVEGAEQSVVRGLARLGSVEDIASVVVREDRGVPIRVRDVASVREGEGLRFGAATRDGGEVVLGMALARIGEDAQGVVEAVRAKLETVRRVMPKGVTLDVVYDRTELIGKAIAMADRAMVEGVVLVVAVLFVFLGELRSAVIVVLAIPMARLIAFLFMDASGLSANLMSLGGLIVGLGMTIDGPIVVVENAFRRLAHHAGKGVDRPAVVLGAVHEVIKPVAFGVLIIIVVFLPLLSLEGLEGRLFKPLAWNMIFAMVGSLVLTVTLVPVLAAWLLRPGSEREPWVVRAIGPRYERALSCALSRPRSVMAAAVALVAVALAIFPLLGREFLPTLNEQEVMFRVTGIPSTSLQESIALSGRLEAALKRFPEVRHATAMIGRGERGETADVNYMEILVELADSERWPQKTSYQVLQARLQDALSAAAPTALVAGTQPIQMRVEELISGVRAPLALKIYGPDIEILDKLAARARDIVRGVPGATEVALEATRGKPQVLVRVDHGEAGRFGASASDALDAVAIGVGGRVAGQVLDGVRRFDLLVWTPPEVRDSADAIAAMPLRTPSGLVSLGRIASIDRADGHAFIRREQLQRFAIVQLDVEGRDVDGFVREASGRLSDGLEAPPGYWVEWGGSFENQRRALGRLAVIVPLTIVLIFLLLYTALQSVRRAVLILANVPFAAVGGIAALSLGGLYLSVPAAVGFIAVFGVAMLNGLVLVNFIETLRREGRTLDESIRLGTRQRLRPVLMTALVEILGLLPFLVATGVGSEVLRPLAAVVIGGLVTATGLTLLVLPVVYLHWSEKRPISA